MFTNIWLPGKCAAFRARTYLEHTTVFVTRMPNPHYGRLAHPIPVFQSARSNTYGAKIQKLNSHSFVMDKTPRYRFTCRPFAM